jgi:hypothetical protein
LTLVLVAAACGAPQTLDGPSSAPPAAPRVTAEAEPSAPVPVVSVPLPGPVSEGPPASPPSSFPARFQLVLARPFTAIALDKPPHLAALGPRAVTVHDRRGWHDQTLPPSLSSARELRLDLFYGRDYRVRVVGGFAGAAGPESVYLRAMSDGLKPAPYEIGKLGNSKNGALVAVLGTADPEVVCRPGELCLIKRTTGWATLAAPAELTRAAIADGNAWVVVGRQVFRADREWAATGPLGPWQKAGALFVIGEQIYVLEPERGLLHLLANGGWQSLPSPAGAPTSLWGAVPTQLWLVGSSGLAHFDGKSWQKVANAPQGLLSVLGRDADDVWFAGASGLYRLEVDQAPVEP